jgi:hypothetical protein
MVVKDKTWKGKVEVYVDRNYPDAWKQHPYIVQLKTLAEHNYVFIHIGGGRMFEIVGSRQAAKLKADESGEHFEYAECVEWLDDQQQPLPVAVPVAL